MGRWIYFPEAFYAAKIPKAFKSNIMPNNNKKKREIENKK